jgi:hypothetical protein
MDLQATESSASPGYFGFNEDHVTVDVIHTGPLGTDVLTWVSYPFTLNHPDAINVLRNSTIDTLVAIDEDGEEEQAQTVAQSLAIIHQLSIERLQELEEENDKENAESGKGVPRGAETKEPQPPNSDHVEIEIPLAQSSIEGPAIAYPVSQERASEWLLYAASDYAVSRPVSTSSVVSDFRQQPLALARKWTTIDEGRISTENVEMGSNISSLVRRNSTKDRQSVPGNSGSTPEATVCREEKNRTNDGDSLINKRPSQIQSSFPNALERWETLSAHWEGLTSLWIRRLEKDANEIQRDPLLAQLARQVTDLSAAGANLFHSVVELQRLRASSSRKFQRWFFDTRAEQERAQELQNTLEATVTEERRARTKAINEKLILKKLLAEMRLELQVAKKQAGRARVQLGKVQSVRTKAINEKLVSEKLLAEMRQELQVAKEQARRARVQLGKEQRMKSEAIANAVADESEKLISDGQKLLEGRYTHGPTWVLAPGASTYLRTLPKFKYLPEQFLVGYLGTCT